MDRLLKRWRRLEGCDSVLELRKRGRQSNVSSEGSYAPQQAVIPGARLKSPLGSPEALRSQAIQNRRKATMGSGRVSR